MNPSDFLLQLSVFIRENKLFEKDDVLLCAISGGLDSMVLAEALRQLGYRLEIAHVNYGLRGKESDLDEDSVRNWAAKHHCVFHLRKAGGFLEGMPGSLQEKARNFRYEWLEALAAERGIRHLLLAHHADDLTETILMQFFRGAGVQGLSALKPASGIRRRPLLAFSKLELRTFAHATGLQWREDASNAGDAYLRNRVRHRLLPLLDELFPGYENVLHRNSARMVITRDALDYLFQELYSTFFKEENSFRIVFALDLISSHAQGKYFITELLLRQGFSFSDATDLSAPGKKSGCRHRTSTEGVRIELHFPRLLLWKRPPLPVEKTIIQDASPFALLLEDGRTLRLWREEKEIPVCGLHEWKVPSNEISFPLCLRLWQAGDRMAVAGMKGRRKKLSDIFTESGLTAGEKALQLVLEDATGKIRWIPGFRKSEPFKPHNREVPFICFSLTESNR